MCNRGIENFENHETALNLPINNNKESVLKFIQLKTLVEVGKYLQRKILRASTRTRDLFLAII